MSQVLVSVFCPDRTGLIAAIAGRLFEIGANLGDTDFTVLDGTAEFSAVCRVPAHLAPRQLQDLLGAMPELAEARVKVSPYDLGARHGRSADISHVVSVSGGDRPGLIARLSEVFTQFKANIVRMDARTMPDRRGNRYVTRFAVAIPPNSTDSCLNTVANTAEELGLTCHWEEAA